MKDSTSETKNKANKTLKDMNILVTGANGQLGNEIQIVSKKSDDHYIFTDVCEGYQKLDITNLEAVREAVSVSSTVQHGPT